MNPATLIPAPDPLQVPWGWFQFLLLLTFFLHIVTMNIMVGCGFIALVKQLANPEKNREFCRDVSEKLTYSIAFTVNFGVAPLLFLQVLYGHFMYTSSVIMGAYWLSIVFFLIAAYYLAYLYKFKFDAWAVRQNWLLGSSLAIMLLIGFFFTNNITLMQTPETWPLYFNHPGGFFLNLAEPTLITRYLHFMVAAVATGGLFLAGLASFQHRLPEQERKARIKSGLMWFSYATMVEIAVGIVFLFNLPKPVLKIFIGGDWLATVLFFTAMAGAFFSVVYGMKEKLWHAAAALGATILTMILVRDLARQAYLKPYFTPADLPVAAQYSPMLLFFAILAIGLGIIYYMLRLAWRSAKEVRP